MQKFLLSAPRCCGFVTSCSQLKFVAVVGPGSESFATRMHRFFQLDLLALGRRNRKPKSRPLDLTIDRRRVVRFSSFCLIELSTIRLEDNSPSRAKPPGG